MKMVEQIVVRTKRIGTHLLNRIVPIAYTRYEMETDGWWVCLFEDEEGIEGWGKNKLEAKEDFVEVFENNISFFKDLLK